MAEFNVTYDNPELLPSTIITDAQEFGRGRIIAAGIGEGRFETRTDEVLSPEENLRFIIKSVGGRFPRKPNIIYTHPVQHSMKWGEVNGIGRAAVAKLEARNNSEAIAKCFERGLYCITNPLQLIFEQELEEHEAGLLRFFRRGQMTDDIAQGRALRLALGGYRESIFKKLRVNSVAAAVTVAYLAGIYER